MHRKMRTVGLNITEVWASFAPDEDPVPFLVRYLDWGYEVERTHSVMTVFAKGRGRVVVVGGSGDLDDAQWAVYERETMAWADTFFAPNPDEPHLGRLLAHALSPRDRTSFPVDEEGWER